MGPGVGRAARGPAGCPQALGRWAAVLVGAATMAGLAAPAGAQAVAGGFDDATVPRRGEARIRILGAFSSFTERYGGSANAPADRLQPLGARFAFDTLGVTQLPLLAPLQSALAAITDGAPAGVSLGTSTANARATTIVFPVTGEYGITRRLSVGVTMPIVRTRQVIDLRLNPDGTTGNVGFNPVAADFFPAGIANDAQQRNLVVQTEFAGAVQALRRLLDTCPTEPGPTPPAGCAPIIANRPAATALVGSATAFAAGVGRVYGTGVPTSTGQPFVPVAGSALQQQVQRRLAALAAEFRRYGVDSIDATTAPAGSPARLATAGLQRILVDPAFGIGADSLQSTLRSSIGDVEVGGTMLLVDTFGDGAARLAPSGVRVRATVGAGFRFGIAEGVDVPFVLFDLPTATGANALLFRGAADVAFGQRAWATVAARWASPLADELLARVTDVPEQPFPELARERLVGRHLGRELELQFTPRYTFGEYVGVAAQYVLRDKAADRYTGTFEVDSGPGIPAPFTIDAATLGLGTAAREQRVGLAITYSTVAAYARRRASLPLEVSYVHSRTVAGSGGTPRLATDAVQLRLYLQLLDRRR